MEREAGCRNLAPDNTRDRHGTIVRDERKNSDAEYGNLEQEILGRTVRRMIIQTAALRGEHHAKNERNGIFRTKRLTVTIEVEPIDGLHPERLKRIANLIDRRFLRSRTTIAHCSRRDAIHRQKASIRIEAQHE